MCLVCDAEITGTDPVYYVNKEKVMKHKDRLSVQTSIERYGPIDPLLIDQYKVEEFPGLLLSPRHSKKREKYATCSHYHSGLSKAHEGSDSLIKFWVGNNLVIGQIPEKIHVVYENGETGTDCITKQQDDKEDEIYGDKLTAQICAAIAPVRPHAYIFCVQRRIPPGNQRQLPIF